MRVNVYAEEITEDIESFDRFVNGRTLFALRVYLKSHPDMMQPRHPDDDRSAVTFWFESGAERAAFTLRVSQAAVSN